jgi:hypothetical protein
MTWKNWGDHPIPVTIGAVAGIVGIIGAGYTIYDHFAQARTNQLILTPSNETKTVTEKSGDHSVPSGANQLILTPSNETKTATEKSRKESLSSDELKILTGDNSYSPTSLKDFFKKFENKSLTDLQKHIFKNSLINRKIIWEGFVGLVTEPDDKGRIRATIRPSLDYSQAAFLGFNSMQKDQLLDLKKNQRIRVTGVVRKIDLDPWVEECKILKVLN